MLVSSPKLKRVISNKLGLKWPEATHEWEKILVRQVNFLNLIGSFNIVVSLIVFNLIGFQSLNIHFFITLGLAIGVILLNYKGKYILGSYLFFAIGVYLLGVATMYMHLESNVMMYFFPLTLSIVQIYGRKELFKHLVIWSVVYFITITFLVILGPDHYPAKVEPELMATLKVFNGLFAYFC